MTWYATDENVPIVANDAGQHQVKAHQADDACQLACIEALRSVIECGVALLDTEGEVLKKYRAYLSGSGQPGAGDFFLRYLVENEFNEDRVFRVPLTPHDERTFEEFPQHQGLNTFDPADRIFVAMASTMPDGCVLNAVDSDYMHHAAALAASGITVVELCQHCLPA